MLLLLLRHADAGVSDHAKWPDDGARPLTDVGREAQRRVSERLRASGLSIDALFTSPLLRARQTAEIVAQILGYSAQATVCQALAPQPPDLELVARCVGDAGNKGTVGLTGHSMPELAALLLGGSTEGLSIDFVKSGAMVIRTESVTAGAGQLVAFITPEFAAS